MGTIPGYLATITVNGNAVNVFSSDATLDQTTEVVDKTTLGVTARVFINGLQSGSMDVTMHTDTAGQVEINTAYAAASPVAWTFRMGALGTHDAGAYDGNGIISDMSINGSVDDEWDTSFTLVTTGPINYTAPA